MTSVRTLIPSAWLLLALWACSTPAQAEQADRQKPMNVEADALRFDDAKQTSQFNGNVVVTQGSLIIRSERMDVRQDAQGEQVGIAYGSAGKRAFFRQKRDKVDEYIEGEALRLEYDSKAAEMRLIGNAEMRRYVGAKLSDTTSGQRIVYRTDSEVFTVDGSHNREGASSRVRATLSPRKTQEPAAPSAAPGSETPSQQPNSAQPSPHGAVLRGSESLTEPQP
jgi:lipopolysaccharide export system protein LptA